MAWGDGLQHSNGSGNLVYAQHANAQLMAMRGNYVIDTASNGGTVTANGSSDLTTTQADVDIADVDTFNNGSERNLSGISSISLDTEYALLSSGQSLYVLVYVNSSGTVTITNGSAATTGQQLPPEVPENGVPLALVTLTFGDTTVDSVDIQDWRIEGPQGGYFNGDLIVGDGSNTRLFVDQSTGNIGLVTTDIEAWNSGSLVDIDDKIAIETSHSAIWFTPTGSLEFGLASNAYYSSANSEWRNKKGFEASILEMNGDVLKFEYSTDSTINTTLSEVLGFQFDGNGGSPTFDVFNATQTGTMTVNGLPIIRRNGQGLQLRPTSASQDAYISFISSGGGNLGHVGYDDDSSVMLIQSSGGIQFKVNSGTFDAGTQAPSITVSGDFDLSGNDIDGLSDPNGAIILTNSNTTTNQLRIGQHGGSGTVIRFVPYVSSTFDFDHEFGYEFNNNTWFFDGGLRMDDNLDLNGNDLILSSATLTDTELSYLDGVTSNIQTQLNNTISEAEAIDAVVAPETSTTGSAEFPAGSTSEPDDITYVTVATGDLGKKSGTFSFTIQNENGSVSISFDLQVSTDGGSSWSTIDSTSTLAPSATDTLADTGTRYSTSSGDDIMYRVTASPGANLFSTSSYTHATIETGAIVQRWK